MPISSPSSSISSVDSEASSVVFADQVPFAEFEPRVLKLCHSLWPSAYEIKIQRLRGGGFNRIIGITLCLAPPPAAPIPLILRVPRFQFANVARDLAILRLILSDPAGSKIPIPRIVAFDITSDNPLSERYTLQPQYPGVSVSECYPALSHTERLLFVEQYAKAVRSILEIESKAAGAIDAVPRLFGSRFGPEAATSSLRIRRPGETLPLATLPIPTIIPYELRLPGFPKPAHGKSGPPNAAITRGSAIDILLNYYSRWSAAQEFNRARFESLQRIAKRMCRMSPRLFLPPFTLYHKDLEPRNILVSFNNNNQKDFHLTAILDWDDAIFAPKILSCKPPMWIWAWKDDDEEDEQLADKLPNSAEKFELKTVWDGMMGREYYDLAYGPECRTVRKLWNFALRGLGSGKRVEELDEFVRKWEEVNGKD